MIKLLAVAVAATAVLSGCKSASKADDNKQVTAAPPSLVAVDATPAAPVIDAAPAPTADEPAADLDPEEVARRAGKRTGLGAPDEAPQVATEALAQALIEGKVQWSRFVDPKVGLVVFDGAVVCGVKADKAIQATITEMKNDQADEAILACTNDELGSAACLTPAAMEGDNGHGFRFVVDAVRGLRLAGLESYEAGTEGTDAHDQAFDAYLEKIAAAKPCK